MTTKELLRSPAVEDYSKAIFSLQSRSDEPVSTNALAERLGITPGSVSAMLKKLDELGLITHVPYRGVRLTGRGAAPGARGDPPSPAARELPGRGAGNALGSRARRGRGPRARALGGARGADRGQARQPHGGPPRRSDPERRSRARGARDRAAWRAWRPATRGSSCASRTPTRRCCATWPTRGISPGDRFAVRERQPFGGPLFVVFGEREHAIGGQLAGAMRVEVDEAPRRSRAGDRRGG